MLECFDNTERIGEERMMKIIYRSKVEGEKLGERPRKGWRDGVKEAPSHRGLSIHESKRHVWDSVSCSTVVYKIVR